ncbi:hypothetical protein [Burkholderia sp. LA-2-3-30-S1-D2]|uniref:hypothetical protein n=1 Tax=Burkholderia sp. LA-2-3-30-S1-D2 TaxID=1637862 RepID=UPI00075B132A|nr:hypothetical protein [Burkholderia sp. LA-2-3-30-S1-D2]AOI96293.1 hypothetical protein WS66_12050 [Burkholderia sp. LA-2-3-30-S1-D2]KVE13903.1 hypothetical protein WS66_00180 [Burkholderia sp. LA-2-3-30-S1-D2]
MKHEADDDRARLALRHARTRAALRMRGLVKLTVVTIAVTQLLTLVFEALLVAVGYAPEAATLLLFRFVTCALVSFWLQADASRAYRHASKRGLVTVSGKHGELIEIAPQCPKRWLVVLSLQLEPRWLNGERIR